MSPYIKDSQRGPLNRGASPGNPGELAFAISQLIRCYIVRKGLSFDTLHSIDGVLGTSQHEFRRRIIDPYEDMKREENGDVY